MENKSFPVLNHYGQSTVEYILLISVIASLVFTIMKSEGFQNIFGEEGTFSEQFRKETEFSYRHGLGGKAFLPETIDYNTRHDTYLPVGGGNTRFFGAKEGYPKDF